MKTMYSELGLLGTLIMGVVGTLLVVGGFIGWCLGEKNNDEGIATK